MHQTLDIPQVISLKEPVLPTTYPPCYLHNVSGSGSLRFGILYITVKIMEFPFEHVESQARPAITTRTKPLHFITTL